MVSRTVFHVDQYHGYFEAQYIFVDGWILHFMLECVLCAFHYLPEPVNVEQIQKNIGCNPATMESITNTEKKMNVYHD